MGVIMPAVNWHVAFSMAWFIMPVLVKVMA